MKNISCVIQSIYACIFLAVCFGCATLISYWLFIQPSEILTNVNEPVVINNSMSNIVTAGQPMIVTRSFCVLNDKIKGHVICSFTNHLVYQLPDTSTHDFGKGIGCTKKQYIIDIPVVLPSDNYEYRVTINYEINPIKTVTYTLTPVNIKVVNPVWDAAKELTKEKK